MYFTIPIVRIITAKLQANGSAKVNPKIALLLASTEIGPLFNIGGKIKQIAVLAINSAIPASNGYKDLPIPCNEFLNINKYYHNKLSFHLSFQQNKIFAYKNH